MSADAMGGANEPGASPGQATSEPSEEELRAAYEAELSRITSTDMIAQAVVSLLNIGARRLGPPGGRQAGETADSGPGAGSAAAGSVGDLEQVRDAIDAVKALLDILERRIPAQELRSLRDALSQLQMAYARDVQAGGGQGAKAPSGGKDEPGKDESAGARGPAEASGKLWVPGR